MTVRATFRGTVIAESDETVVVEGNHYFPRDSVRAEYLEPSDHHSTCGWKGIASYHHVVVDDQRAIDAAWFYPDPLDAALQVKDRVAFWHGVAVE